MRSSIRTALAVLLLVASIAAPACGQDSATSSEDDEYAEEEKAFLIVRKAPLEDDVVVGSNLTVVIDIHNAGSSSAYSVDLQDILPPAGAFSLLGGSPSAKFDRIAVGATERHAYSVTPKVSGVHKSMPATVTYKPDTPSSTEQQVVYSTDCTFTVLSHAQNYTRFLLKLGRFMTMGLFTTVSQWARIAALVGSIGAVLTAHWLYTSVTEGRKQRRYQRALEDVAKMK